MRRMYDGGVDVQIDGAAARGVTACHCRRSAEARDAALVDAEDIVTERRDITPCPSGCLGAIILLFAISGKKIRPISVSFAPLRSGSASLPLP